MRPAALSSKIRSLIAYLRRFIAFIPLLAVLLHLGICLLISGPWTSRLLTAYLAPRLNLPVYIGNVAWSPWRGLSLNTVMIFGPPNPLAKNSLTPLLVVKSIHLNPNLRSAFRGKLDVQRVTLDSPNLQIPMELVANLLRQAKPVEQKPAIAAATPQASHPAGAPAPADSPPVASTTLPPPESTPPIDAAVPTESIAAVPASTATPEPPAAKPLVTVPQPTRWLELKNASISLYSSSNHQVFSEIKGITGSIPISGDATKSALHIASISALGSQIPHPLDIPFEWKSPLISVPSYEIDFFGQKCLFSVKFAYLPGLPIQVEFSLPSQALTSVTLPMSIHASAQSMIAGGVFRGLILSPASWVGELQAQVTNATVLAGENSATFDRGSTVVVLQNGLLSCLGLQLIGDDLSFLANATISSDARLAACARIVSSPGTTQNFANQIFPQQPGPRPLTPMSSDQRAAFDVNVAGYMDRILIRLGLDGPIIEYKP